MYKVRSNDGDTWSDLTLEEAVEVIRRALEEFAKEEETKRHNSLEVYWLD